MIARERAVIYASAALFACAAAAVFTLLPDQRSAEPLVLVGLTAGYALVSRVRFEFGSGYVVPEQLVFVPVLALVPLIWVPLVVVAAGLLAMVPDFVERRWHRDRWLNSLSDAWFCVPPVLVLAAFAPGAPTLENSWVYGLAFLGQVGGDLLWSAVREHTADGLPLRAIGETWVDVTRVDGALTCVALMATLAAAPEPLALLALAPLVWLLQRFAQDREERYAKALELGRAYRGTVKLLSDLVEHDDPYTASHSRSLVDICDPTAQRVGLEPSHRQTLEFAALLHDVGKIAIPKTILNKPGPLDHRELELMRTHTIEGQFMLDRVGGFMGDVGEIVRSSHEHWDGAGYPDGLAGEEIPLTARIITACDAFHAMVTDRVYRPAMPVGEAMSELRAHAGTQFDPAVVTALAQVVQEREPELATVEKLRPASTPQVGSRIKAGAA